MKDCVSNDPMASRAPDKSKRKHKKQLLPFVPTPELVGDLGTGQPDEICIRKMVLEGFNCIVRTDRSKLDFDIRNQNARMNNQIAAHRHTFVDSRKADFGFERVPRGNKPPYRIKSEIFHRDFGVMNMSGMGRIKRTAQKTDPFIFPAGPIKRMRWCQKRAQFSFSAIWSMLLSAKRLVSALESFWLIISVDAETASSAAY